MSKLILIFIFATAVTVLAQDSNEPTLETKAPESKLSPLDVTKVQYFGVPREKSNLFTAGVNYSAKPMNSSVGGFKSKTDRTMSTVSVDYLYGVGENVGVGLAFGYGQAESKPENGRSTKSNGLTDITLQTRGTYGLDRDNSLLYGLGFGISPGNAKTGSPTSDGNLYSGGVSLKPVLGYTYRTPGGNVGLKGSYLIKGERQIDRVAGGTTKLNDGHEAEALAFFEAPISDSYVDIYAGPGWVEREKGESGVITNDPYNDFRFGAEARIDVGEKTHIFAAYNGVALPETRSFNGSVINEATINNAVFAGLTTNFESY